MLRRATAARWRLLALLGAFLATIPTWPALDDVFRTGAVTQDRPNFEGGELALLVAIVLVVPITWVAVGQGPGRLVGALLVASVTGWSLTTRLWASWATPPTVDDVLRGYLIVGCAIVAAALWLDRHRNPITRLGLALLGVGCAAIVALPTVGNASTPARDALLPLPKGVVIVAEDSGCESGGSCERGFQLTGTDPQATVRLLTRHLEDRGWRIGDEHQGKACRRLGYLANPYRACVSVSYLRGPGTVEVRFDVFNPREPRISY
ncbi:hypothetical protein [Asanoa sp. NPDC050611]|uniref:hypothetical protein n=1 Tax=Asanoa sp. NPDC050611 TaxID=3157098 RepID=UPI0033CC371E